VIINLRCEKRGGGAEEKNLTYERNNWTLNKTEKQSFIIYIHEIIQQRKCKAIPVKENY
jgi:hypothetical protein